MTQNSDWQGSAPQVHRKSGGEVYFFRACPCGGCHPGTVSTCPDSVFGLSWAGAKGQLSPIGGQEAGTGEVGRATVSG
jgi:hypothetical protein